MAAGLYEAPFAAVTRVYREEARAPISAITLIGGCSSTIGWPVSALLEHLFGWRGACLAWALINITIALPLNATRPPQFRSLSDDHGTLRAACRARRPKPP